MRKESCLTHASCVVVLMMDMWGGDLGWVGGGRACMNDVGVVAMC